MNIDWTPLTSELKLWRAEGLHLPLWWRDDDAVEDTPRLRKALIISDKMSLPLHLAIIPKHATKPLADMCQHAAGFIPMVHGWSHTNHAPAGQKKAEFGHPRDGTFHETTDAIQQMQALFGPRLFPMFVPPWNRIAPEVVTTLNAQGYTAVSTYLPRQNRTVAGLTQINTHVDPIHWKAGGGLAPADQIIARLVHTLQDRRSGRTDATEPLGFLTHHLVHDAAIWDFTERCLSTLLDGGAVPCNLWNMKERP